jgi:hypothetical protein
MIAADLIDRARSVRIEDEISRRGIRLRGSVNRAGACPVCGGHDRFSINTQKQVYNCRGCDARGNVIALVRLLDGCTFAEAIERLTGERTDERSERRTSRPPAAADDFEVPSFDKPKPVDDSDERALASANRIVSAIVPLIGTPGATYLRDVRKIDTTAIADVLATADAIGWHPAVYFNEPADPAQGTPEHPLHGRKLGCIVGVMTDAVTAKPTGAISRTYLTPDGTKIGKAKTLARPRGIVRLSPDDEVTNGLFICEGIETALTGMANFDLRPMWSTGDRMQMAAFPLLGGIEALTIMADHDASGDGEKAARNAEARWLDAGRKVRVFLPPFGDLNDALRGSGL